MVGGIIIIIVLTIFPVMVLVSGAIGAAILGTTLRADAITRNEGSELIELNT